MTEAGVVALAYLIGSIPMAYVLGRVTKRIDIRSYGSGNAGASNVWVHLGKRFALPLGAFDIFVKGAFPVYLARELGTGPWVTAMAGLATVAGHNWSLYLKLTGGRGVTVALGVLLVLTWKALAVFLLVAIAGGLIFRSRALWVGIAMALTPALSIAFGEHVSVTALCAAMVFVLAAKRVMSNRGSAAQEALWRKAFFRRLLYDRDVSSRDEWVYRTPPEA